MTTQEKLILGGLILLLIISQKRHGACGCASAQSGQQQWQPLTNDWGF